ncbi:hypothetical protein HPP92_001555 [Vanilla planifolia]|uniref:Uncharacterized protein n=1 Tax=Vanilla planifolia TaxID=51239 RepID=A0A835SCY8_VANPL|nr:hypothetical protein HPP92_001555 [Vanilla planifolia]
MSRGIDYLERGGRERCTISASLFRTACLFWRAGRPDISGAEALPRLPEVPPQAFFLSLQGFVSLKAFEKRRNSYIALVLETVCALGLAYVMGQRYIQTSKIMPAGVVAGLSALMAVFYIFKIATGGNHIPAKAE